MLIRGLGAIGAMHGGELTRLQPAQQRILAVLMAAGPDGLSADHLAEELWPDSLPSAWEGSVRKSISRMRRAIGLTTIENSTRHYSLAAPTRVDVWQLLTAVGEREALSDEDLASFVAGEPYPAVELSALLRTSIDEITTARVSMLTRRANRQAPPSAPLLDAARQLITQQPYREDVLISVAQLHIEAGLPGQAAQLLTRQIDWLEAEIGQPVGAALHELHIGLLTALETDRESAGELAVAPARMLGHKDLATTELRIERGLLLAEAKAQLDGGGLVVTGQSGSGKTVLARQLAAEAFADGSHVLWFTAQRDQSSAYGPLLATLPSLHSHLAPLLHDGGDPYSRTQCWSTALDAISRSFSGRQLAIFVDDAQWLDSHSQMFFEFLAASRSARGLALVVVGRADSPDDHWRGLVHSFAATGLPSVVTSEFDRHELADLVGRWHPALASKQRADLAGALADARADLPAIANELLRTADPASLVSFGTGNAAVEGMVWTQSVGTEIRAIAAAAAVVGMTFRLESVAALVSRSDEEVLLAIDDLISAQLVTDDGQRPDEFSFRHLLIRDEFEASLDRAARRKLHLKAASQAGSNHHQRAAHLLAAAPAVTEDDLRAALITSARLHLQNGSFREAVQAFRQALEVATVPPEPRVLHDYANSLDLSGADGSTIRQQAFTAAQTAQEHDLSVEIAVGCAHETENIDGDQRRAALLKQVDLTRVGFESLQSHRVALARELSFLGEHDRSLELSSRVVQDAAGPDDRCAGWIASWPTFLTTPATDWPPMPDDRGCVTDPQLRAGMLQVECVRALLVGHDSAARDLLARCSSEDMTQHPLRAWFASLLRSMVAFTDGDWHLANEIADQGVAQAQRVGITSAFSARAAQAFGQHWVMDNHGDLLPLLEEAAPDVQGSMLAEAGYAAALAAIPARQDEARKLVGTLVRRVTESKSPLSSSVAALLAPATAALASPSSVESLSALVAPFAGTSLVVGTGVTHLGPATRSLSILALSPLAATELMTQAVQEADQWNLRVWSVRCRLDLADLTGDDQHRADARRLAAGTDLATEMFGD